MGGAQGTAVDVEAPVGAMKAKEFFDAAWFLERAGRNLARLQREFPESDEFKAMSADQCSMDWAISRTGSSRW